MDSFSSFISISLLRLMLWRVKTIFSPLSLSRSALIFLKDLSETSERDANCLCKDSLESFNSLIPFWASSKRSKRLLYKLESSSYLSSFSSISNVSLSSSLAWEVLIRLLFFMTLRGVSYFSLDETSKIYWNEFERTWKVYYDVELFLLRE